jgi:hypothetical protein
MTKDQIAAKYSLAFALWYCRYDPDHEATPESVIADMYEAWLAGHNSSER